jgi:O-antigen/teichoic acid export membrane protein
MLAQKLVLSYYSKIASQMIQIAVSIVVARVAGPTVLGTVAFGLAFANMFKFLADLGIGTAHIKLISGGRDEAACIGTFARMKLFLIGVFFMVVLSIFLIQKHILHHNFESIIHERVILISLISLTIQFIFFIPRTTFAAKTEQAKQDLKMQWQGLCNPVIPQTISWLEIVLNE